MEAQLVHAWLHKMYPRVFIEQEVLRVLTELNAIEITCIACAHITTCDFHSSLNRAVPYLDITKDLVLLTCCFTDITISRYTVLYSDEGNLFNFNAVLLSYKIMVVHDHIC